MDKKSKIISFNEYTEPKSLEEILEMDDNKAMMHLQQLDESAIDQIIGKAIDAVAFTAKATFFVGKLAAKGIVAGGRALMKRYNAQARADRKRAKMMKKADKLTRLRMSKEDMIDARQRIADEQKRLADISADEKALNKAKINKAKKELEKADKALKQQLDKLKRVKI